MPKMRGGDSASRGHASSSSGAWHREGFRRYLKLGIEASVAPCIVGALFSRPPAYFDWTAENVPEIAVWRRKNPGPLD